MEISAADTAPDVNGELRDPCEHYAAAAALRELWHHRDLYVQLVRREISVRYKQSAVGMAWAVIPPICTMVIFTVVFSQVLGVRSDDVPYPVFSFAALVPWHFFARALQNSTDSVVRNTAIIGKVSFPREIIPLAGISAGAVDAAIASVVLFAMLLLYGMPVTLAYVLLPVLVVIEVTLVTAIALFSSALNVYYRDVRYAIPLAIGMGMYACPIIYPLSAIPEHWQAYYLGLNPMAAIIQGFREILLHGGAPDMGALAVAGIVSLVLMVIGYVFFKRLEKTFADVI